MDFTDSESAPGKACVSVAASGVQVSILRLIAAQPWPPAQLLCQLECKVRLVGVGSIHRLTSAVFLLELPVGVAGAAQHIRFLRTVP